MAMTTSKQKLLAAEYGKQFKAPSGQKTLEEFVSVTKLLVEERVKPTANLLSGELGPIRIAGALARAVARAAEERECAIEEFIKTTNADPIFKEGDEKFADFKWQLLSTALEAAGLLVGDEKRALENSLEEDSLASTMQTAKMAMTTQSRTPPRAVFYLKNCSRRSTGL